MNGKLSIDIIGHTDVTGVEGTNLVLSKQRADVIFANLVRAGVKSEYLRASGVGTSEPLRNEDTEEGRRLNRSVTFKVAFSPRSPCKLGRVPMALQKKICMLGSYSVGKTSLVRRFVESIFTDVYHSTIGVKIDKKVVRTGNEQVDLVIWDIHGEDILQKVQVSYLRGISGYLLVVDGTRRQTLEDALTLNERITER